MALIANKKIALEYEILESFEAGVELHGFEVKALRNGVGSLEGARVMVRGAEAFLTGTTIPPYQAANAPTGYDPERPRRLLLNRKEIAEIAEAERKKGLTVIPKKWYNKSGKIKLEVVVVRRKKKYDKRQTLKERDTKRDIERTLKNQ